MRNGERLVTAVAAGYLPEYRNRQMTFHSTVLEMGQWWQDAEGYLWLVIDVVEPLEARKSA